MTLSILRLLSNHRASHGLVYCHRAHRRPCLQGCHQFRGLACRAHSAAQLASFGRTSGKWMSMSSSSRTRAQRPARRRARHPSRREGDTLHINKTCAAGHTYGERERPDNHVFVRRGSDESCISRTHPQHAPCGGWSGGARASDERIWSSVLSAWCSVDLAVTRDTGVREPRGSRERRGAVPRVAAPGRRESRVLSSTQSQTSQDTIFHLRACFTGQRADGGGARRQARPPRRRPRPVEPSEPEPSVVLRVAHVI